MQLIRALCLIASSLYEIAKIRSTNPRLRRQLLYFTAGVARGLFNRRVRTSKNDNRPERGDGTGRRGRSRRR